MHLSDFLALWGAILSTVAITWNVLRDVRERAKLRIDPMIGRIHPDSTNRDYVVLTIANVGRRPVLVKGWGGRRTPDGEGRDAFLVTSPELPKMLKEGEYVIVHSSHLEIVGPATKEIHVWDSSGRNWRLSKNQLKHLRAGLDEIASPRRSVLE
jgi:hypothetical protein